MSLGQVIGGAPHGQGAVYAEVSGLVAALACEQV